MDHYPPPPVYASASPTPGNGNLEASHVAVYPPPPPPPALARGLPVSHQQLGGGAPGRDSCEGHDPSALLVGATLITMLAFLLGTFIPGGQRWRQRWGVRGSSPPYRCNLCKLLLSSSYKFEKEEEGREGLEEEEAPPAVIPGSATAGGYWQQDTPAWSGGKRVVYRAGDPIMRDLHRPRYWVFRAASWVGVASSMVLTLSLLVRTPAGSRHVQWSFVVAYSSLLLTFAVSQTKTHLSLDIIVWLAVLAVSWLITTTSIRGGNRARIMKLLCCGGGGDN